MAQDLVSQGLLSQGIELTLFGMGTVVVFLTLLVFVTSGMSAFVARFFPTPPAPPAAPAAQKPAAAMDARLLAVISAAVHRHRSKQQHSNTKQDQTP